VSPPTTDLHHVCRLPAFGLDVHVVSAADPRVPAGREIEVAVMTALGDPEAEVREEFRSYDAHSMYFLALPTGVQDAGALAGMGRMIPWSPERPNKTLSDLATMPPGRDRGGDEAGLTAAFALESGCRDPTRLWDFATLAPRAAYVTASPDPTRAASRVAKAIMGASAEQVVGAWGRGELTHVTAFNEHRAHAYFTRLGYPFRRMLGLPPVLYDSFGSGVGMTAQPAWLAVEELVDAIEAAGPDEYLAGVRADLRARGVLDADPARRRRFARDGAPVAPGG